MRTDPHPLFDSEWYLQQNPDVASAGVNPLQHYMTHGWREGRDPNPLFDTSFYLEQNPDVAAAGVNPLMHYSEYGWKEGRNPHPAFDSDWYLGQNKDVAGSQQNPLAHFVRYGWKEGRNPNPHFDTRFYLKQYGDVRASGLNPLYHYHRYGQKEGRQPRGIQPAASSRHRPKKRPPTRQSTFDFALEQRWKEELCASPAYRKVQLSPPLVSIVLPTKDRRLLLLNAVESVVAQSYKNWELLVIDDGSTDGTADAVRALADPRIKLLHSGAANVSITRNIGLSAATGQIVAYLDSDDVWLPDYLALMAAELERSKASTFYAALRVDGKDHSFFRSRDFSYDDLTQENYISLITFAHLRTVHLSLGGFDENLRRMVDWELILRYTRNHKPTFAPFICAIADNSPDRDRITTREGAHYRYVIQNNYLIDWNRLSETASERDPHLVSVVICVYNQSDLTKQCLNSLLNADYQTPIEIIVVDNGSDAATASLLRQYEEKHSQIRIISNEENLNFALGNNIGFSYSKGSRVVFLNNDTTVSGSWLDGLLKLLRRPEIKGVQPKLLFPDGRIQCAGITFSDRSPIGYPIYAGEPSNQPYTSISRGYQAITAACMAVRANDFIALKGFDPNYINGQEDVDFCLRLGAGAPAFWCASDSVITHHESRTEGRGRHIEHNRKIFVERWRDQIVHDDTRYYSEDGLTASGYTVDNQNFIQTGVACWKPTILHSRQRPVTTCENKKTKIAIKCPVPNEEAAQYWGDYHFANSLAAELRKNGFEVRVDIIPNWYSELSRLDDVVLVLRGLSRYEPRHNQVNLCWLISHPESVTDNELELYDHVFVASKSYSLTLSSRLKAPVSELLQFSDPDIFHPAAKLSSEQFPDVIFVGNSRKQMRSSVQYCIDQKVPVAVYGRDWEGIIPSSLVKGEHIPNKELHRYYSNAKIVLNDHWPDMARFGFVSNRLFDIMLSGGFALSDNFAGSEAFGGKLATYSNSADLRDLIHHWLRDDHGRRAISNQLKNLVLDNHTVHHRAMTIAAIILDKLNKKTFSQSAY